VQRLLLSAIFEYSGQYSTCPVNGVDLDGPKFDFLRELVPEVFLVFCCLVYLVAVYFNFEPKQDKFFKT
jgi:hypothetical protein